MTASSLHAQMLFDFQKKESIKKWVVIDDVVMGGKSDGKMYRNKENKGVFSGVVSLDNNGGFSSVRHAFPSKKVGSSQKILLRIKGDGKKYQFRIKHKNEDYYSYRTTFTTKKEWETIEIKTSDLAPTFRGRKLDMPNFNHQSFEQIGFLIANKKNERFELLIDSIEFK